MNDKNLLVRLKLLGILYECIRDEMSVFFFVFFEIHLMLFVRTGVWNQTQTRGSHHHMPFVDDVI